MGRPYSKAQGGAAIVVAAADTPGVLKSRADLVCTGTSSTGGDEDSINAALGRADTVILCPGTFWVNDSIIMGSNKTLKGSGAGTVIKIRDDKNADFQEIVNSDSVGGNTHITVRDLKLDGNRTNQAAADMQGIWFRNVSWGFVERCVAASFRVAAGALPSGGIRFDDCSYCDVEGNLCYDNQRYGLALGNSSSYITVRGNSVDGGYACIILASTVCDSIIDSNVFLNADDFDIHLYGGSSGANCRNIISNNVCIEGSRGIGVENLIYAACNNIIQGNTCYGNARGIYLYRSGFDVVQGNYCIACRIEGIYVAECLNVSVCENCCIGNSQALSNNADDILVGCDNSNIHSNFCRAGAGPVVPRCGIVVTGNANVVMDNDLYNDGFGTAPFVDGGTNTIIRNNRGYNPVGISSITVGVSPFTYTADASPETVYVSGGTVSSITKGGNNFGLTSGAFNLEPYESIIVTYTVAPTMYKDVH